MDAKFVRVLDSRVKEVVKEVKKINGKKTEEVVTLFGFSIKVRYRDKECKISTGPFMTEEQNQIIKGQADYPTDREEVDKIFRLQQECDTAESRVKLITEELMKAQKDNFQVGNVGAVAKYATGFNTPDRKKLKLALCRPDHPFNVKAAIAAIFPELQSELGIEPPANQNPTTGQETTKRERSAVEDAEVIEEQPTTTPVHPSTAGNQPGLTQTAVVLQQPHKPASPSGQAVSANQFTGIENFTFKNFDDLYKHADAVGKAALLAQLHPYIGNDANGDLNLTILRFNPNANFLKFYLEEIDRRKNRQEAPISVDHEEECLYIRKLFITFLEKEKYLSKNNPDPYFGFKDLNKPLFERFDQWMIKKKKYARSTASSYLSIIRSVVHEAEEQDIINKKLNVFRNKNRFKIPVPPPNDRSLPKEDMEKFLSYVPNIVRNHADWSEQKAYDFFLMSIIAFGINMMDLLCLKKKQIKKGSFSFKRAKIEKRGSTAVLVTVVITEPLQILMDRWKHKEENDSEYFFPFMDLTEEEKKQLDNLGDNTKWGSTREIGRKRLFNHFLRNKVDKFTGRVNSYMKKIASKDVCDFVRKDVTAYFARHTFANDAINNGIHPYRIMQALGQKCFESFMRYANGVLGDEDMAKLQKMMFEKVDSVVAVQELNEKFVEQDINLVDDDEVIVPAAA